MGIWHGPTVGTPGPQGPLRDVRRTHPSCREGPRFIAPLQRNGRERDWRFSVNLGLMWYPTGRTQWRVATWRNGELTKQ